jgi:hypothetical protein
MKIIKIITLLAIFLIILISTIFVYTQGVNGGCEREFNDYKEAHNIEDYGSWSCGYDDFAVLIFIFGLCGLFIVGVLWEE